MLYRLRAYESRAAGETGRVMPKEQTQTGDWNTAKHYAQAFASYFGACIVVNTETGERTWFPNNLVDN